MGKELVNLQRCFVGMLFHFIKGIRDDQGNLEAKFRFSQNGVYTTIVPYNVDIATGSSPNSWLWITLFKHSKNSLLSVFDALGRNRIRTTLIPVISKCFHKSKSVKKLRGKDFNFGFVRDHRSEGVVDELPVMGRECLIGLN